MSLADELLATVSTYPMNDSTEEHIVINQNRFITVPASLKRIAVQYDNNVETVTFDCPRYWDKHDMSKMKVYINYIRADHQPDSYPVDTGVTVDENDPSIMHFDWTISSNVTEVHGKIVFLVCIKSVDENGDEHEHWNSELCTDMYVSEGLETQQRVAEKYPDLITHLLTRMDVVENKTTLESMLGYLDTYFTTDAEINNVLKDYVDVYLRTDDSVTKKIADTVNAYIAEHLSATDKTLTVSEMPADAAATGEAIKNTINITSDASITDSVDGVLKIKKLYGRSEQETIPGNQLLDLRNGRTNTGEGVTFTNNGDGTYKLSGTATGDVGNVWFAGGYDILPSEDNSNVIIALEAGTYTVKDCILLTKIGDSVVVYRDTFTLTEVTKITGVRNPSITAGTTYNTTIYPMLNKGTTALPWEPYCGGIPSPNPDYPQEIKSVVVNEVKACGKNLLDINSVTDLAGYLSATALIINGDKLTFTSEHSYHQVGVIYKNLPSGTYTFGYNSQENNTESEVAIRAYYGKSTVNSLIKQTVKNSLTFDYDSNNGDLRIWTRPSNGNTTITYTGLVLCKGSTLIPWEPYTESTVTLSQPITLNGIGDVMDELTSDGVVRKFIKLKMSADLSWEYRKTQTYGNHNFQIRLERNGFPKGSISKAHIAAVKFTHFMYMDDLWDTEGLKSAKAYVYSDEITFSFPPDSEMNSLELWKKFLTDNEVYAYYVMTTPYTEPIPAVDAKALKTALRSYNTATYVTTDSPVTPGFELEYPRTLAASYILEDQKNVAELMSPIREVSGVGDLTIDDSVAGGLRVTKMVGKSVQETVPGNNLYDSSFRLTYAPVLCTHGSATELDGVYTLIVTAKDCYINMHSDVGSSYVQENGPLVEIPEGVTQLHVSLSNPAFTKNMVGIFDGDKISLKMVGFYTSNFVVDLSSYPTAKYITLRFGLPDTISSGTYETTVMINAGSTALPYEPYTGGIPSPNPEYPQPIVSVGEKMATGKNLNNGEVHGYYLNGGVNLCGITVGNTDTSLILTVENGIYTVSSKIIQARYRVACLNELPVAGSTVTPYNGVSKDNKSDSVTIDCTGYKYLIVNATDITAIQVEKGSIATEYEPYTGGKKAAFETGIRNDIRGKNLLKNTAKSQTINGVTFTVNEDGSVTANGTATADVVCKVGAISQLPKGDYIGNGCPNGGSTSTYFGTIYKVVNGTNSTLASLTGKDVSFFLAETTEISYMARIANGTTVSNITFKPMIRLASIEDDTYVPYVETQNLTLPRKLRAIPVTDSTLANYTDESGQMWVADTIEEIDGKMCLVERVYEEVFDGSDDESWTASSQLVGRYKHTMLGKYRKGKSAPQLLCSSAIRNELVDETLGTCWIDSAESFNINTSVDTLANWKLYLNENPMTVQYILATPIVTELTNDEIIALRSLKTYHGITHIFTDNNPTGKLTVSYGATELGGLALENKNLHEVNEALDNKLEEKVEENAGLIATINSALPFEIIIDDAAGTINFVDRQVGD